MSSSSPTTPRTLVIGARRGIGRLVLDGLVGAGEHVRASARSTDGWSPPEGVEGVRADLADPTSLRSALAGVEQVFLFAVAGSAHAVARAARDAGVARVVLLSSGSLLVPASAANPIADEHRAVEDAFRSVGGPVLVPVRPLVLATNDLAWAGAVRAGAPVPLYRPDALMAPVHEADVAAVALAALTPPDGATVPPRVSDLLTGPRRLSRRDQVAAIGRALDRPLAVLEQTRAEAHAHLSRFVPGAEAEAVLQLLDDCAAGSSPATGTAAAVLGRPPRSFDAWVADHLADYR